MIHEIDADTLAEINKYADEADECINEMVTKYWDETLASPQSEAYLGNSIAEGVNRALEQLKHPTLSTPRMREIDPAIDEYLDKRGGQFITWLTDSGKEDFRKLLTSSYRENGTMQGFEKAFRKEYPQLQKWKAAQIWKTESGIAANNAQFSAYEQLEDVIGFRIILGNRPCPFCRYQASYDHKLSDQRPGYHVNCYCLAEPIVKGVHTFSKKKSNPLDHMDKKVYKRLNTNYKNFKKESVLPVKLPVLIS